MRLMPAPQGATDRQKHRGKCEMSGLRLLALWTLIAGALLSGARGQQVKLLQNKRDPYGSPRPANGETNVPTGTSIFFELNIQEDKKPKLVEPSVEAQVGDFDLAGKSKNVIDLDSISVQLHVAGQQAAAILSRGQNFAEGYFGKITYNGTQKNTALLYIDSKKELEPSATYFVSVSAKSRDGAVLGNKDGQWKFTTEVKAGTNPVTFQLDLSKPPVRWHGGFFTGFCKTTFCTSSANRMESYALMDSVRKKFPKAWSVVRDIHLGMEYQPKDNPVITWALPNIVRERETRRIVAIEESGNDVLLRAEDFFGHEQYGIASNRPLAGDYHPGDEILIADGISDARAKVIRLVDDSRSAPVPLGRIRAGAHPWYKTAN